MNTYTVKANDIKRDWHVIDASGRVLGEVAAEAAKYLMGKHKPMFCRNLDCGDYVIIVNAKKITVTGNKLDQKMYYRHSGFPGGFRQEKLGDLLKTKPLFVIEHAVKGMIPRNTLGAQILAKLKVYEGAEHPHASQTGVVSKES